MHVEQLIIPKNTSLEDYMADTDPVTVLSSDIMVKIFFQLSVLELGKIATVSQNWLALSEKKELWMRSFCNLSCAYSLGRCIYDWENVGRSLFELDDVDVRKIKATFCTYIKQALENFKYLSYNVKGEGWFEEKTINLLVSNKKQTEAKSIASELNKKFELVDKIKRGFISNLFLYRDGLTTIEKVKLFASTLQDHYGDSKGWSDLAIELLTERKIDEAIQLFEKQLFSKRNTDLMPLNEISYVIKHIVQSLCESNKFDEALIFFESHRGQQRSDYLNQVLDTECLCEMREIALKMKRFDFYEKINQKYPGDVADQARTTFLLIEALLIEDRNKAYNVYKQYDSSQINTMSDDFNKKIYAHWYKELSSNFSTT